MIWLTWRQFRLRAWVMSALLALMAALLAVAGLRLAHLYDVIGVPACHAGGDCGRLAADFLSEVNRDIVYLGPFLLGTVLMYTVPAVIGMFWGAPLITREIETGTFRLAWSQSVTRTRWLAAKLGTVGLAAMAAAGLLSVMLAWADGRIFAAAGLAATRDGSNSISQLKPALFGAGGVAPLGYAAFAFMLGVTAAVLIRRTVPAMAAAFASFAVVQIAWPLWVRPYLIPPVHIDAALNPAHIDGMTSGQNRFMQLSAGVDLPNAWIVSNRVVTASGQPFSHAPKAVVNACYSSSFRACQAALGKLHLRQLVSYQPASRYWEFQWVETAIFLGLALALAGLSAWWLRRRFV